jgi:hypothetical protein
MTTMTSDTPTALSPRARILGAVVIALLILALFGVVTALLGFTVTQAWAKERSSRTSWSEVERHGGQDFDWNGAVASGKTIEVLGINGNIHAEPADGRNAEVHAEKSARKSDPDGVKIEVHETADGVQICARYPRPDGELNDCGGSQQTRNNDVVVDFTLKVPAGVHLVAHTVNGAIEVDHLSGDVEANTVNGSIDLSTSGGADAHTVNGSIHASVGRDHWNGGAFETVNGAVVVTLPEGADAEVRASTVNGHVSSDFALSIAASSRIDPRHLHATIGSGGPMLSLSTVNGEIALRSSGGSKSGR